MDQPTAGVVTPPATPAPAASAPTSKLPWILGAVILVENILLIGFAAWKLLRQPTPTPPAVTIPTSNFPTSPNQQAPGPVGTDQTYQNPFDNSYENPFSQ